MQDTPRVIKTSVSFTEVSMKQLRDLQKILGERHSYIIRKALELLHQQYIK